MSFDHAGSGITVVYIFSRNIHVNVNERYSVATEHLSPTYHIEVDETSFVSRALVQRAAFSSEGVPRAVEVVAHDVDHIQGPGSRGHRR